MAAKHLDMTTAAKVHAALQQHEESAKESQTVTAREAVQMLLPDIREAVERGLKVPEITAALQAHIPEVSAKTWSQYISVRTMRRELSRGTAVAGRKSQ
jgi:hypothetical protein